MIHVFPPSPRLFPAKSAPISSRTPSLRHRRRRCSTPPPPSALFSSSSSADVDAFTKYSGYIFEDGASSEAEFLDEYDIRKIAAIYRRKPILVVRRFAQIGTTFGRWFALRYLDRVLDRSDEMFKVRAAELRMLLLELGPAFVKIAQAVSSRPVYQARLRSSGQLVAVKVQRPGVQAAISLDIFILRFLAGLIRRAAKLNTDLQAVLDEWASSLFRV